jgi:enoyl-CoA hydratase/carnithine racemase
MTPGIQVELSSGVLTVTISRPDKKNALTNVMYGALADAVVRANTDSEVRVLLFQADGEIFTAAMTFRNSLQSRKAVAPKSGTSRAFFARWPTRQRRSSPLFRGRPLEWARQCCCIATTC